MGNERWKPCCGEKEEVIASLRFLPWMSHRRRRIEKREGSHDQRRAVAVGCIAIELANRPCQKTLLQRWWTTVVIRTDGSNSRPAPSSGHALSRPQLAKRPASQRPLQLPPSPRTALPITYHARLVMFPTTKSRMGCHSAHDSRPGEGEFLLRFSYINLALRST